MLANIVMNHQCSIENDKTTTRWYGFELHRKVEVVEKYTLGEARSQLPFHGIKRPSTVLEKW